MKPCSVVNLIDSATDEILVTKRNLKLSFGGAWVLPGGHLELNETII